MKNIRDSGIPILIGITNISIALSMPSVKKVSVINYIINGLYLIVYGLVLLLFIRIQSGV